MMKIKIMMFLFCAAALFINHADAAFTVRNGKLVDAAESPTLPVQDHFNLGMKAMQEGDWDEAARQFRVVTYNFPTSEYANDALFYQGVAEFQADELDAADEALTAYLKSKNNPQYFQEAIEYKFHIAEKYRTGYKRRFFGSKRLPKWASGSPHALLIYDEVIAALPCHNLAAQALYSKGILHWKDKQYRQSIDAFQMLIRRFPKNELTPEAYVAIAKVYRDQSKIEFQNPDVLAFAEINLRKFKAEFPREERIAEAEQDLLAVKERFARGLYDTGQLFERKDKPMAAIIYYQNAIKQFPETKTAQLCIERLEVLKVAKR